MTALCLHVRPSVPTAVKPSKAPAKGSSSTSGPKSAIGKREERLGPTFPGQTPASSSSSGGGAASSSAEEIDPEDANKSIGELLNEITFLQADMAAAEEHSSDWETFNQQLRKKQLALDRLKTAAKNNEDTRRAQASSLAVREKLVNELEHLVGEAQGLLNKRHTEPCWDHVPWLALERAIMEAQEELRKKPHERLVSAMQSIAVRLKDAKTEMEALMTYGPAMPPKEWEEKRQKLQNAIDRYDSNGWNRDSQAYKAFVRQLEVLDKLGPCDASVTVVDRRLLPEILKRDDDPPQRVFVPPSTAKGHLPDNPPYDNHELWNLEKIRARLHAIFLRQGEIGMEATNLAMGEGNYDDAMRAREMARLDKESDELKEEQKGLDKERKIREEWGDLVRQRIWESDNLRIQLPEEPLIYQEPERDPPPERDPRWGRWEEERHKAVENPEQWDRILDSSGKQREWWINEGRIRALETKKLECMRASNMASGEPTANARDGDGSLDQRPEIINRNGQTTTTYYRIYENDCEFEFYRRNKSEKEPMHIRRKWRKFRVEVLNNLTKTKTITHYAFYPRAQKEFKVYTDYQDKGQIVKRMKYKVTDWLLPNQPNAEPTYFEYEVPITNQPTIPMEKDLPPLYANYTWKPPSDVVMEDL